MFRRKFLTAALAVAVAAWVAPAPAAATFYVKLSGGTAGSPQTINDADPQDMTPLDVQVITLGPSIVLLPSPHLESFTFGGYEITLTATTNSPALGVDAHQFEVLGTVRRVVPSPDTATPLKIEVFADLYDGGVSPSGQNVNIQNTLTSATLSSGGSVKFLSEVSPPGGLLGTTPYLTLTSAGFQQDSWVAGGSSSPFSIRQEILVSIASDLTGLNTVNFTSDTVVSPTDQPAELPVPAPAGLVLVATVVPFFGVLRRRMKSVPTT